MNFPLLSMIFTIAFTVIVGILIIVAVVTGNDSSTFIIGAVVLGGLISLPATLMVAKRISSMTGGKR